MGKCVLAVILACFPAFAQSEAPEPAEGCKDSPLVSRMKGAVITECSEKEYDAADLPVKKGPEGAVIKSVEGAITRITYWHPKGVSALQIARNYEAALKKAGFSTLYEDSANEGTSRYLTLQRKGAYVNIESGSWEDHAESYLTIVKQKEMEQEVVADAGALLEELNRSGRVAVYGIYFDTGKAAVKPESAKVLGEVAKLLQENPELKVRVEGHTDNVGKGNLELSKKRAAAVKEWLVKNGVEAGRLSTDGFGDTKPVADNQSDEGRAKNRRVELVKI